MIKVREKLMYIPVVTGQLAFEGGGKDVTNALDQ
jgi:hypothetical protein